VSKLNPKLEGFDSSCFNGEYVTGDIDAAYLDKLRDKSRQAEKPIMGAEGTAAAASGAARAPKRGLEVANGDAAASEGGDAAAAGEKGSLECSPLHNDQKRANTGENGHFPL